MGVSVAEIHDDTAIHGVYTCAGDDEWCVASIHSDNEWHCVASFLEQHELVDDPRFATGQSRVANYAELVGSVVTLDLYPHLSAGCPRRAASRSSSRPGDSSTRHTQGPTIWSRVNCLLTWCIFYRQCATD
ncbi:CoA transferase [Mycobacterium uberis]|uniref:CoA transferase n=1 Tax=Mycobacterium uberis TaxID=2162698 RepID=UPI001402F817